MPIIPIRVFFQKKGRLKYISHLDTMRVFSRALSRSGLPIWHTEGYNQRVYITFALPLSLGYEGRRESFDIRFVEDIPFDEAVERLNNHLPEELNVLDIATPVEGPRAITWADYELELYFEKGTEGVPETFQTFLQQPQILMKKKSKNPDGFVMVDLQPYVTVSDYHAEAEHFFITMRAAAGSIFNVNPRLYVQAFSDILGYAPEGVRVTRTKIMNGAFKEFA